MKCFCFELTDDLYEKASRPIRKKEDIISLIVYTIKVLLSTPILEEKYCQSTNKVILFVDRMSRLFFCVENKIFTINFPFFASKSDSTKALIIKYHNIEIDSYISSLIISVFTENDTFSIPLDNMKEFVFQHMAENGWEDAALEDVCEIIKNLIVFETGYLRYDHDEKRANSYLHPEDHIDFYYDSSNEIKIGMKSLADYKWMIDFANVNTDCKYLK